MDQKEIEAKMRSPLRCGGLLEQTTMAAVMDKSTTDEAYIDGVMEALRARDQYVLENKLRARANPGPNIPRGPTTAL